MAGEIYEVKITAELSEFLKGLNKAVNSINDFNKSFQKNIDDLNNSIDGLNKTLSNLNKNLAQVNKKSTEISNTVSKKTKTSFGSLMATLVAVSKVMGKMIGVLTLGALMWTWYRDGTLRVIFAITTLSRTLGELTGVFAGFAAVLGQVLPGELGKTFRGFNFMFNMLRSLIKNVEEARDKVLEATTGMNKRMVSFSDIFKDVYHKYTTMWNRLLIESEKKGGHLHRITRKTTAVLKTATEQTLAALIRLGDAVNKFISHEPPAEALDTWFGKLRMALYRGARRLGLAVKPVTDAVKTTVREFDENIIRLGESLSQADRERAFFLKFLEAGRFTPAKVAELVKKARQGNKAAIGALSKALERTNTSFAALASQVGLEGPEGERALESMLRIISRTMKTYTESLGEKARTQALSLRKVLGREYGDAFRVGFDDATRTAVRSIEGFQSRIEQLLGRRIVIPPASTETIAKGLESSVGGAFARLKTQSGRLWEGIANTWGLEAENTGRVAVQHITQVFTSPSSSSKLFTALSAAFTATATQLRGTHFFKSLQKMYEENFKDIAESASKAFQEGMSKTQPGAFAAINRVFSKVRDTVVRLGDAFRHLDVTGVHGAFKELGHVGLVLFGVLELLVFQEGKFTAALGGGLIRASISAISALTNLAKVTAYVDTAMASLTAAVNVYRKTTGDATKDVKFWTNFLRQMADATGTSRIELLKSGGAIIDMASSLAASTEEVEKFTKGVIALARLRGRTIYQFARTVRGAVAGNATSLIILGASLEDVGVSYEKLSDELGTLEKRLTGAALKQARAKKILEILQPAISQASNLTHTYAAAVGRLQGAWLEFIASVGRSVQKHFVNLIDILSKVVSLLNTFPEEVKSFVGVAAMFTSVGIAIAGVTAKVIGLLTEFGALGILVVTLNKLLVNVFNISIFGLIKRFVALTSGVELTSASFKGLGSIIRTLGKIIYGTLGQNVDYIKLGFGYLIKLAKSLGGVFRGLIIYFFAFEIVIKFFKELERETGVISSLFHLLQGALQNLSDTLIIVSKLFAVFTTDVAHSLVAVIRPIASLLAGVFDALARRMDETNKKSETLVSAWAKVAVQGAALKVVLGSIIYLIPGVGTTLRGILFLLAWFVSNLVEVEDAWKSFILLLDKSSQFIKTKIHQMWESIGGETEKGVERLHGSLIGNMGDIALIVGRSLKKLADETSNAIDNLFNSIIERTKKAGYIGKLIATITTLFTRKYISLLAKAGVKMGWILWKSLVESILHFGDADYQKILRMADEKFGKPLEEAGRLVADIWSTRVTDGITKAVTEVEKLLDTSEKLRKLRSFAGEFTLRELWKEYERSVKRFQRMRDDLEKALHISVKPGSPLDKLQKVSGKSLKELMHYFSEIKDKNLPESSEKVKTLHKWLDKAGVSVKDLNTQILQINRNFRDTISANNWDAAIRKLKEAKQEVNDYRKRIAEFVKMQTRMHLLNLIGLTKEDSAIVSLIGSYSNLFSVARSKEPFSELIVKLDKLISLPASKLQEKQLQDQFQRWVKAIKPFFDNLKSIKRLNQEVEDGVKRIGEARIKYLPLEERYSYLYKKTSESIQEVNKAIGKAVEQARALDVHLQQIGNDIEKLPEKLKGTLTKFGINMSQLTPKEFQQSIENIRNTVKELSNERISFLLPSTLPTWEGIRKSIFMIIDSMQQLQRTKKILFFDKDAQKQIREAEQSLAALRSFYESYSRVVLQKEKQKTLIFKGYVEGFDELLRNRLKGMIDYLSDTVGLTREKLMQVVNKKWFKEQLIFIAAEEDAALRSHNRRLIQAQLELGEEIKGSWNQFKSALQLGFETIANETKNNVQIFHSVILNAYGAVMRSVGDLIENSLMQIFTGKGVRKGWEILRDLGRAVLRMLINMWLDLLKTKLMTAILGKRYEVGILHTLQLEGAHVQLLTQQYLQLAAAKYKAATAYAVGSYANITSIFEGIVGGKQQGGLIPGTGNKDSVPTLLTPGEFVIRKEAVRKYGKGFFEMLNKMSIPIKHFSVGGLVPSTPRTPNASPIKSETLKPEPIRIVNVLDPRLLQSLGPSDVVNIISADILKDGVTKRAIDRVYRGR